uniref:Uncharacterized protein LOC111115352 n=1 Tax=Crassostrea virginica TaxID=6565 RepID=A0A8B8C272_CRAVI|nr:uncharacterized protein LOC111115352 [Crassostrea virginica]
MATSTSWAQNVITCDLCDKAVQQLCNSCQVSLCEICIKKHRDEVKSLPHDIVPFLHRTIQEVFPECQEHSGQRCEVNCKDCNKPFCLTCIKSGTHKGHDVEKITETHENTIRKVKSDTEEMKANLIPKYQKEDVEIGKTILKTKSNLYDLGKESRKLRYLWHEEVDKVFDKLDSSSLSLTEKNLNALQEYQNKIRHHISEMNSIVKQNENLVSSNQLSEINKYKSKLNEYQDFPEHKDLELPSLVSNKDQGGELIIEIGGYRATLKQMSQHEFSIIATITTNYKPLWGVACVGGAEAWIYGDNKTITRIAIHGTVLETVTSTFRPGDISVTRGRDLIYSNYNSDKVNIVTQKKSETLITSPQGWVPKRMCCARSGDILVHLYKGSGSKTENKIIRYQEQKIKQEINEDGQGNPIFKDGEYSLFMSENDNGDVCVSDVNADSVVVVDKIRRVRFRYDGKPARRELPFDPRNIVTDSLCQIIVADYSNDCLHILHKNGQFLKCIDNWGLDRPYGLSVDSEERLWVGCDKGEIKVFKYLEQL